MNVHISPSASQINDDNGIGRIIHAQYRYLPTLGISLVGDPQKADVIACHIQQDDNIPRVDVLHCHGLYWTGDAGGNYTTWHHVANGRIASSARRAIAITVPSEWVAEPFRRDMRIAPHIIGHGIELDQWRAGTNGGYILWNKNRPSDVCDPTPAWELAQRGISVVSTFAPIGKNAPAAMRLTGAIPHADMKRLIQEADVYLATTKETFGIGTLEALASGVPVLGYRWGGTADLITHKVDGYLVLPGDIEALHEGLVWLRANRTTVSEAARRKAEQYSWGAVMQRYANLYQSVADFRATEPTGVSAVITSYNYGRYVGEAIESLQAQNYTPDEIIVVDDGSTDSTAEVVARYPQVKFIQQKNQGVAAARNRGIAEATQPFIVCLDADDNLDPRFVAVCRKALLADRGLGIAYTGITIFNDQGHTSPAAWPPNKFVWEDQAKVGVPPSNQIPSASLFRRAMWERAGGYQQVWAPGEDAEFWTRGLSVGFTARCVTSEHLFWYRVHEGSASRAKVYRRIDDWHPWMRDYQYPFAAPASRPPLVRSYAEALITVIIPVGPRHWRYVPSALDSLLGQTFRGWCVILVNDSGEPAPEPLLRPYPFAIVMDTQGKRGASSARNVGLGAATSPLVLFLDADDYLLPEALAKMTWAYIASNGRYAYSDWIAVTADGQQVHQSPEYKADEWLYQGQHAITVLMETAQARAVGGFDETLRGWEDWDFFVKCAIQGFCGVRVPEPLMGYRLHSGSRRNESLERKEELLATFRERYASYGTGGSQMGTCCGGNGGAILEAKRRMGLLPPEETTRALPSEVPAPTVMVTTRVRMEYVGQNQGAIRYTVNGHHYNGGNNDRDRYHDMPEEDARALELHEHWRRVPTRPALPTHAQLQGVSDAPIVPSGGWDIADNEPSAPSEAPTEVVKVKSKPRAKTVAEAPA